MRRVWPETGRKGSWDMGHGTGKPPQLSEGLPCGRGQNILLVLPRTGLPVTGQAGQDGAGIKSTGS